VSRLNISGETVFITYREKVTKRRLRGEKVERIPVRHTYQVTVTVDEQGAITGALVVEKETDKDWLLLPTLPPAK
jgi:hypothetical protein